MIPFYIFYSMFGFQRTGDQIWAFGDAARPRLPDGRDRRPDDARPARACSTTTARRQRAGVDGPELPRLRPGVRLRDGRDRPRRHRADVRHEAARTSSTTSRSTTRTTRSRPSPRASTRGSCAALYRFAAAPDVGRDAHPARLVGSGSILQQVLAARDLLAEQFGVAAEVSARRRSSCSPTTRSRPSAGTASTRTQEPRVPYVSTRSCRPTAGRSSPRPTG